MAAKRPLDRDPEHEAVMSFGDHLDELRHRLVLALLAPIPIAVAIFFFADTVRHILEAPLRAALVSNGQPDALQALGVAELMGVDIKLAIIASLVLSAPWILYQTWKFIEPGLYEHERRFARFLMPGSMVLVLAGVAVLYWILLPIMLQVLVRYGIENSGEAPPALVEQLPAGATALPILTERPKEVAPGQSWIKMPERTFEMAVPTPEGVEILGMALTKRSAYIQQFRESEYVDLVLLLLAGIAIVFQMPLVILLLGWAGIVRVETLRRNRKKAFFGLTIVAAIITPTSDAFSMFLMLVPLYLLYELGILLLVAAPPGAVAQGSLVRGFLTRIRTGRRTEEPSGKGPRTPAQTESPARATEAAPPADLPPRREPPDADEPSAGDSPT